MKTKVKIIFKKQKSFNLVHKLQDNVVGFELLALKSIN